MAGKGKGKGGSIIIRREEIIAGGHHGGAWKVAYADFVTAMMAFFLLMWLINATTEQQRKGLADYFAPSNELSHQSSGVGKPFSGASPAVEGTMISSLGTVQIVVGQRPVVTEAEDEDRDTPAAQSVKPRQPESRQSTATLVIPSDLADAANPARPGPAKIETTPLPDQVRAEQEAGERAAFARAAQQIREAVQSDPALAELAKQLAIDITPDGLRIQILDEERRPMFATGSSVPNDRARALLHKIAPILARLPQPISIAGHTDAAPYRGTDRGNWELSTERANATRRTLVEASLAQDRIRAVTGHADRDLLLPADPLAAANRRIAILVLHSTRVP